jgi:putative spermidine/putrescine transport system ATP-binding protein
MQFEIKHIHERLGVTVVYVTHDQGEALTMSTRIAVFNRGRIEQLAPPADIYERPASVFVAGFIGENNALPGRVVGRRDGACVVALDRGPEITVTGETGEGTPVIVSLRPERLMLGTAGANRLEAEVAELIYLGDHVRIHLTGPGNQPLVAKLADRRAIAVGEKLPLSFDPTDAIALPVS